MSKFIFIVCCFLFCFTSIAQKNLAPVQQTKLLELPLPTGSKQDKRFLSVSAAKLLLEIETKKAGVQLMRTEVYILPAGYELRTPKDLLTQLLVEKKHQSMPVGGDEKYHWVQGNNKSYLVYVSIEKKQTDLYIAECNVSPVMNGGISAPVNNHTMQGNTDPPTAPVPHQQTTTTSKRERDMPSTHEPADGYTFNTSHFDDGWKSTIANDYVLVEKANNFIYLLFAVPYIASQFSGTGVRDAEYYWDQYVTRYFTTRSKQFNDGGSIALKPPYMEGAAIDKRTGKPCFIGMYLNIVPNAVSLIIGTAPDEARFRQLFPKANDPFGSDLSAMTRYNKFAVASSDLIGKWQNGNTETAQWYYTSPSGYEGYAGMTVASTSATFHFYNNGSYKSVHNGATGAVGNMNTFQQEYKGTYTVSNWLVTASNRYAGKTDRFDAYFIAVRGGRLLKLNNGAGQDYTLVKSK